MSETIEKKRMAGVLMPVASLPGADGVGGFGREAYEFVDLLAQMKLKIWQILPLNPLGFGNSPYQPYSSYAGDELYIDLEMLQQQGYLSEKRSVYQEKHAERINYEEARKYKEVFLKEASASFWERDSKSPAFEKFLEMDWVYPYAVFIALKKKNGLRCWNEWPKEEQNWILDQQYDISPLENEIRYQLFLQYMFSWQWKKLKAYANEKNVMIMGDVPFYVGIDSLDVWQTREDFLLDSDGRPTFVAGVPPDYFSRIGQRWGNPIYNWNNMAENDFTFWVNRLKYSRELYDIIRIDHFRAFDTYWKIPASCDTAVEGEWLEAPGYALLDTLYEKMPDLRIVAEDLGDLRPEVLLLRDYYGLAGMNIAEFSLLGDEEKKTNQLIYTGTHDNQTVRGWYKALDSKIQKRVRRKLHIWGDADSKISDRMIAYICNSTADTAIIPMMDILKENDEARLNTPGTVGSPNWEWKMRDYKVLRREQKKITNMIRRSGRC